MTEFDVGAIHVAVEDWRRIVRSLHVATSVDERMGGSVLAPLSVARSLIGIGEEAEVAATHESTDSVDHLGRNFPNVTVHLFPRAVPRHNFRSPGLRSWLRDHVRDYDIVQIHSVFSFVTLYAAWACIRTSTPFVVCPHGQLEPYDLCKHRAFKLAFGVFLVRPILSRARAVLAATAAEVASMRTFGARCPQAVATLPVFESTDEGDGLAFRTEHGIPAAARVVLFIGRFDEKKGLQFLIPALADVKAAHPDLYFLLAGGGQPDEEAHVISLIELHGIAGWTRQPGFVSGTAKKSAFAASDCLALPSLNENFGITVVEALLASVPVVVSSEVYVGEVPVASGVGLACEPTVASCASALSDFFDDGRRARQMVGRAREVALHHFAPDVAARELTAVYDSALAARTGTWTGR